MFHRRLGVAAREDLNRLIQDLGVRIGLTFREGRRNNRPVRVLQGGIVAFGNRPLPCTLRNSIDRCNRVRARGRCRQQAVGNRRRQGPRSRGVERDRVADRPLLPEELACMPELVREPSRQRQRPPPRRSFPSSTTAGLPHESLGKPNATVDSVRKAPARIILGNHRHALLFPYGSGITPSWMHSKFRDLAAART